MSELIDMILILDITSKLQTFEYLRKNYTNLITCIYYAQLILLKRNKRISLKNIKIL